MLSEQDRELFRRAVAGVRERPEKRPAAPDGRDGVVMTAGSSALPAVLPPPKEPVAGFPVDRPQDDQVLFEQAMVGVKPLRVDTLPPYRHRRSPRPLHQSGVGPADSSLLEFHPHPFDSPEAVAESLWFNRGGLQHSLLRKLRKGRLTVGAELDLHGMNSREAHQAVDRLILEARRHGVRCVRIIHGKGHWSAERRPVLKGRLDRWLRERDEVLAFSSAPPEQGGGGALHAVLRRRGGQG